MIYIFFTPNSPSSTKAINFFKKYHFDVKLINIIKTPISSATIGDILSLTTDGFDDIIAKHSNFIQEFKINLADYTYSQLIHLIQHEPTILKKPIILQYKNNHPYRLMIGYNKDDIRIFLRDLKEYTHE